MAKIIVFGHKEIDAALKKLGDPKLINKIARAGMRSAMKPILSTAKGTAPVGETSDLKNAIKLRAGKAKRSVVTMHVNLGDQSFGEDKFYPKFKAFGSRFMKKDDWMRQAYLQHAASAKREVIMAVWKGIEQKANKK